MFDWFWEFLYSLLKAIFYCIDFIMLCAKKLMGLEPVYHEGTEVELLGFFFRSEKIWDAVRMISMIGIVLLFLFTAFSVVRAIGKAGEGKTPLGVCVEAAKSLLLMLLIPAIMIISSYFVTAVMKSVDMAISDGSVNVGANIFTVVADEACNESGDNKERLMDRFRAGEKGYDYYSKSNVKAHFNLKEINYFIGYVAGFVVLLLLIKPMLTFVERIVSLTLLFIVAPISVASSVLDDGKRFKLWRDQVVNKFLIAYGALIALNVFIILVDLIFDISFFPNDSFFNGLARLLFILGAAFACRMGTVIIGNIVNEGAGSQYAADMHNMNASLRGAAAMGVGAVVGGAHAASALKSSISEKVRQVGQKAATGGAGGAGGAGGVGGAGKAGAGGSQKFTDRISREARGAKHGDKIDAAAKSGGKKGDLGTKNGIGSILAGTSASKGFSGMAASDKKDAANRESAATVKEAMKVGNPVSKG